MTADEELRLDPQAGVGATLDRAAAILRAAGIEAARLEARLLVVAATGLSREALLVAPRQMLDAAAFDALESLVARRTAREPISQILGAREFWSLSFRVTPDVLTPRPDSETLVETVLDWAKAHRPPATLLDLGTGSGCLLLALLHELPGATGLGIDRSAAALEVAAANARTLGLAGRARFQAGNWTEGLGGRFEVIVSNPPYIPAGTIPGLEPEVARYEPRLALDGGRDGLDAYRSLLPGVKRLLAPGGLAALEVGAGQADAVATLAARCGLQPTAHRHDLAGVARVVQLYG